MSNKKISELNSGTPLQDTDMFPIARSGVNYKVSGSDIRNNGTMVQIYDNTVSGSSVASWDITSIPSTYEHLKLLINARGTVAATSTQFLIRFNNDTASNYGSQRTYSTSGSTNQSSGTGTTGGDLSDISGSSSDSGASTYQEVTVIDYKSTNFHKGYLFNAFNPRTYLASGQYAMNGGGIWKNTSAINRITIYCSSGNIDLGSRVTLYGIL